VLALEIVPHYTQGVNPCKAQFWNLHFSAESLVLYADNICTGDTLGKATLRASDVCHGLRLGAPSAGVSTSFWN
jgi:hypothetical protein